MKAIVRLVPLLRRFGLSVERFRTEVRLLAARAHAPRPIRERIVDALLAAFDSAPADALARFVDALFVHDWPGSLTRAIAAALAAGNQVLAFELVAAQRHPRPALAALARHGVIGDELVASVELADVLAPSLPLLKALTDQRVAERLAVGLRPRQRPIAQALLARLEPTPRAAHERLRSIREESVRSMGGLAVVRYALMNGKLDEARWHAARIERALPEGRARLEIARYLAEHGETRDALRELATILDRRLWTENILIRTEIRLAQCRDRTQILRWWNLPKDSWQGPAWAAPRPMLDLHARSGAVFGVGLLRIEQREKTDAYAFNVLRRARGASALIVELCRRFGVDLDAALTVPREPCDGRLVAELQVAQIAYRATELAQASLPTAMRSGVAGEAPTSNDARELERAAYDEGLALSERGAGRRRVLINAAQHCVRSALASPEAWEPAVVESRLRTLVHLGGELGTGAIRAALATQPIGRFSRNALEALCVASPQAAANLLLTRQSGWTASGIDVDALLDVVEANRGVERGFALAHRAARKAIVERSMQRDSEWWLTTFFDSWRTRFGTLPGALVLRSIGDRSTVPKDPAELFAELDQVSSKLARASHYETFEALRTSEDLLAAALVAAPARADASTRTWDLAFWREHLQTLADDEIRICRETVRRAARVMRRNERTVASGALEQLGVPVFTELVAEEQAFRLRLLDKRADVLTYLRFADVPARSCFRSDAESWYWSADAVANVWRDPLSLVFHVERNKEDRWRPCGFLFGSFVELREGLGIAFNALHVRPNREPLRVAIVEAVEKVVCKPLGVTAMALANCHGGRGPLPSSYQQRAVEIRRFRALRQTGALQLDGADDIGACNQTVRTTRLWWHDLE